ncbi:MAG: polysaccharide deacetylase family protein [Alphaproteobacteria bacterium]
MPTWHALNDALDRRADAGLESRFWWRDDDAGPATPALERLLALHRRLAVPLAVAAIPARLDGAGALLLSADPGIEVLQHGWDHANHAPDGAKRIELGGTFGPEGALAALKRGFALLTERLRALPVLVPPWNRIAEALIGRLAQGGYRGLSGFGPRTRPARDGLTLVNVHVDVIAWHEGRGFVGEGAALAAAVTHLCVGRAGERDPAEPIGLLTHHAVHDEASWRFVERFVALIGDHPRARWIAASEAFGLTRP